MTSYFRSAMLLILLLPACVSAVDDTEQLKLRLKERFSDLTVTDIRPAAVAGLYEVTFGTRVALVSADGNYLITGDLIDLTNERNITAERRAQLVLETLVERVGEKNMIVYGPARAKHTITVFTDVDCPYCRKLHDEVAALTAAGVKVRYLLYPRAGKGSETYKRSVAIWCAKDRNQAAATAMTGGKLEMKDCKNPVDEHLKLGAEIGVTGTPTIVLDDGRIAPGYVPAAQLLGVLGLRDGEPAAGAR